jgi:hypothetical protein
VLVAPLSHHGRMADGTLRDTCDYSVLASEWPTIRRHSDGRLETGDGEGVYKVARREVQAACQAFLSASTSAASTREFVDSSIFA